MTLYSKNGGEPQALPASDRDASGDIWTNLAINQAGRAACGWIAAPDAPAFDPEAATLAWSDGAWHILPLSAGQLAANLADTRSARLARSRRPSLGSPSNC